METYVKKIKELTAAEISHDPSEQGDYESGYKSAIEEVLQILSEPADVMGADIDTFIKEKYNPNSDFIKREYKLTGAAIRALLEDYVDFASLQKPVMKRHELIDKINDIQDKVDKMGLKGQNEYDLFLREEIADFIINL